MDNEKKFLKPNCEIVEFNNDDIILTSGETAWWGDIHDIDDVDVP